MAEVAKLAGVSQATVSRVVNEGGNVSPDTVRAVREAMSEIGYPGPRRRTWGQRRSGKATIVLVTLDGAHLGHPHMSMLKLSGVLAAAAEAGVNLLMGDAEADGALPPMLEQGEVAGLLLWGRSVPQRLRNVVDCKPVVWLSSHDDQSEGGDVVLDGNAEVGRIAFEYLRRRGAERLAFICPTPDVTQMRVRGNVFAGYAQSRGMTVQMLIPETGTGSEAAWRSSPMARALVDQMLDQSPKADGLFVPDDSFLPAVYRRLAERGMQPGIDLAIVGCNNEPAYLDILDPRPATIDLAPDLTGRMAVEQLLRQINGVKLERPVGVSVQPQLVEGE